VIQFPPGITSLRSVIQFPQGITSLRSVIQFPPGITSLRSVIQFPQVYPKPSKSEKYSISHFCFCIFVAKLKQALFDS
jgi:hypothetical protein